MLNIFNHLKKETKKKYQIIEGNSIRPHKRDVAVNKEWYNSVYAFDKNYTKFLPAVHNYVFKLLTRYFNITSNEMEDVILSRSYLKKKRWSGRKVWVSTPEIKHLSDNLIITIYVYNRVYNTYKKRLDYIESNWWPGLTKTNKFTNRMSNKYLITTKQIKNACDTYVALRENYKPFWLYVKMIKWLKIDKSIKMEQYKTDVVQLLENNDKNKILLGLDLLKTERYNYLINQLKKELIYLKLKRNMLFNKFKFSEFYFNPIIEVLQTIYKKKVIFNIVTLKNYFLSTSILSQITVAKVRSRKLKGKSSLAVDNALSGLVVPALSSNKLPIIERKFTTRQNIILDRFNMQQNKDNLNQFLLANNSRNWAEENTEAMILSNLDNKSLAGIFMKISGRLTKRFKAQRATSKTRSRGTLKNVHSAHKGFSSNLSRGYSNINVEKTMMHSNTRIGSFGLTGWISSY